MTVRRYTFVQMVDRDGQPSQDQGNAEWRETPDGKWVIYEDYASLESANRAMNAVTEALSAPILSYDRVRERVYACINQFQDILSWQNDESRNGLICEIRDKVDALFKRAFAGDGEQASPVPEAQRAELAESRVKELSKPVTNEEGEDAGLFDDGMTDGQLRSWMSKVNTQMLELILTTRPLDKPAWYVRLMTEEVQRRRLESRREQ